MNRRTWAVAGCLLAVAALYAAEEPVEAQARRMLEEGRSGEAVSLIEEHGRQSALDADLHFLLAEGYHALMDEAGLLKKRGYAKKMKQALHDALALDPAHVEARRELADFYFYAPWIVGGDRDKAEEELDRLETIDAAEAHATRGEHARNDGDFERARDHFRLALETGPRTGHRLYVLGFLEQQLGNYGDAIALLDESLAEDPAIERAYYYRARASAMTGEGIERGLECAEHYLEHCAECGDPERGYGWWRKAILLKRKGDEAAAVEAYREALRLNPELDGAREALAELER